MQAADVMPTYISTVPENVYGFLAVGSKFDVYENPDIKSAVVEKVSVDRHEVVFKKHKLAPADVFAVYVPHRNYAFLFVLDEDDGWYNVLYDKKNLKTGWVKPSKTDDFWNLREFYSYYGKKHSLYFLRDRDVRTRTLRSAPADDAQGLQGFSVTKNIKLQIIRGNWALVSVVDFEGTVPKTGFIKWRDKDGTLYLFPQMDY